jgi:hypothetical protein
MSISLLFACGLAVTAFVSIAVVTYLQRPLCKLLEELCGTRERAQFWTVFSNVTVVLVPVIFAMQYQPLPESNSPPLLEISAQLKWGLLGLVISILVLGRVISRFIPRGPLVSRGPSGAEVRVGVS